MANRIIKDEAFINEKISSLTDFEFRLWVGLITQADDCGRGDARPAIIKGRLFPLRERVTAKDIDAAIHGLAAKGCVSLYTVDGKPYFWFPTWGEHQRVRDCRPKYPSPEEADETQNCENDSRFCGELRQAAASCGELRKPAETCGELRPISNPIQSESNPNPNPNITPPSPPPGGNAGAGAPTREGDVFAELSKPLKDAVAEFKRFRTLAKKPLTDGAIKRLLLRLDKLSDGDEDKKIAILRQSVDHGWTDVYGLKEESHGQQQIPAGGHASNQPFGASGSNSTGQNAGSSKLRYFGRPDLV